MSKNTIVPTLKNHSQSNRTKWARMGSWPLALLTFNFAFLISACGLDIEDPTPPSPPVWVQKSLPEEWPERGIDAHESGGIFLEWKPNPDEDIAAYLIFWAQYYQENDSLGDYEILGSNTFESTISFSFLHSEAVVGKTYYYKIKAEGSAGNLSVFSESIRYTLLPSLTSETMSPNGNDDTLSNSRLLNWGSSYRAEMEDYCITVLTQDNNLIIRVRLSPTNYVNGEESWRIPESAILDSASIYKWRVDAGAQYINNTESFGSESPWATFLYRGP